MSSETTFLSAFVVTLLVSGGVVIYLRQPLQRILIDLCGAEHRARFWTAYANVILMLMPIIALMLARDAGRPGESAVFLAAEYLQWALMGLVASALMIAAGVAIFIWPARAPIAVSPDQADDLQRLLARVEEIRAREVVDHAAETRGPSA